MFGQIKSRGTTAILLCFAMVFVMTYAGPPDQCILKDDKGTPGPALRKAGQANMSINIYSLSQMTADRPFGNAMYVDANGSGPVTVELNNEIYHGNSTFVSCIFSVSYPSDQTNTGNYETRNIVPAIIVLDLVKEGSSYPVKVVLEEFHSWHVNQDCLDDLFSGNGYKGSTECGETMMMRPYVSGFSVDEFGNPTNPDAVSLANFLHKVNVMGRTNREVAGDHDQAPWFVDLYVYYPYGFF